MSLERTRLRVKNAFSSKKSMSAANKACQLLIKHVSSLYSMSAARKAYAGRVLSFCVSLCL